MIWKVKQSRASFSIRVELRTVSNALLKSKDMTTTNGSVRSRLVTVLRRKIIAAVGDPDGRKANWSVNDRFDGEVRTVE